MPITTRRFEVDDRSTAASRSASIGATFAALRAGRYAAITVTTTPMTCRDDQARRRHDRARAGELEPEGTEHGPQTLRRADPGDDTDRRGEDAGEERLHHHRAGDLPALRADRPEQRGLLGALGDRDREGVVDHERPDHERHDGEDHQEHVHELHALAGRLLGLLGRLGAGEHLDVTLGERPAQGRRELGLAHARLGDDLDRGVAAGRADGGGRGLRRERHDLGARGAVVTAVGRDPGEPVRLRARPG